MVKKILFILLLLTLSISYAFAIISPTSHNSLLLTTQPRVLPAAEAFKLQITFNADHSALLFQWNMMPDYYLYRDKIKITPPFAIDYTYPAGQEIADEFFGNQIVYFDSLQVNVALPAQTPLLFPVTISYQGCAKAGFCYPPETQIWQVNRTTGLIILQQESLLIESHTLDQLNVEPSAVTDLLQHTAIGWVLLIFYALGLLLTFTPCVLPMIPILSSIIIGQNKRSVAPRSWHGFALSWSYVMGMVLTYTLAGIFAGLAGLTLQSYLQAPLFIGLSALLFVLLSLSLLGCYELRLPAKWHDTLQTWTHRLHGGRYWSACMLGILSALIVSPCVTAPLIGVLTYISTTGNAILGGSALFSLALGMGTPLIIIGTLGPHLLPRSGRWLVWIQKLLGLLLLIVACWMIGRILPPTLIPSYFLSAHSTVSSEFIPVKTWQDIQREIQHSDKPILLDVYADWCVTCKVIEQHVFPDPLVVPLLKQFTLLRIDVTAQDTIDKVLQRQLQLFAPPALLFFMPNGDEWSDQRLVGDITPEFLAAHLEMILQKEDKKF